VAKVKHYHDQKHPLHRKVERRKRKILENVSLFVFGSCLVGFFYLFVGQVYILQNYVP
jgi:hypothetical protein